MEEQRTIDRAYCCECFGDRVDPDTGWCEDCQQHTGATTYHRMIELKKIARQEADADVEWGERGVK